VAGKPGNIRRKPAGGNPVPALDCQQPFFASRKNPFATTQNRQGGEKKKRIIQKTPTDRVYFTKIGPEDAATFLRKKKKKKTWVARSGIFGF